MSYQQQEQQSDSVVVNGTVEGMEVKANGRFVIKVRELGSTSQYALSLNTKEQGLANQMSQSIGQQFSFICGLSHWTNNQGQPVTSKWINGVAPLQGQPHQPQQQAPPQQPQQWSQVPPNQQFPPQQQQAPAYTPQPQQQQAPPPQTDQRPTDDAYIRRVSFLAAVGPAVDALAYLPEEQRTVPALVKMADFLAQTAILRGQQGFGQQQAPPQAQAQQQQQYTGGDEYGYQPPATDDDIPF